MADMKEVATTVRRIADRLGSGDMSREEMRGEAAALSRLATTLDDEINRTAAGTVATGGEVGNVEKSGIAHTT